MEKKNLEELKRYLEELKTVSKTLISEEERHRASIVEIQGVKFIPLDDITKGHFITSESYRCTLNNGEEIYREKLQKAKKDGSAVLVIPVTDDDQVITTVEPRVFIDKTVGVGFPAGYVEAGEEPHIAALRELKEEVGCVPKYLIKLASFYQDEGISAAKNFTYLAVGCVEGYEKNPDPGEFVRYFKCNFNDVKELEREGYIAGCGSIIAIAKASEYFDENGKTKELKLENAKNKIMV